MIVFYLIAASLWLIGLRQPQAIWRRIAYGLGFTTWVCHAWLLYQWIDFPSFPIENAVSQRTQNLHASNVFSLVIWTAILLLQLLATKRPRLLNLAVMLFPLAAGSILVVQWLPGYYLLATGDNLAQLIHVIAAIATFSALSVATLQAIMVGIQDSVLRRKKMRSWVRILPPLESMETILVAFVLIGFIGLSIVLLDSVIMAVFKMSSVVETHSPYLAVVSWLTFLAIIIGHRYRGWHGRTMMWWTMFGVLILSASYFGVWLMVI